MKAVPHPAPSLQARSHDHVGEGPSTNQEQQEGSRIHIFDQIEQGADGMERVMAIAVLRLMRLLLLVLDDSMSELVFLYVYLRVQCHG